MWQCLYIHSPPLPSGYNLGYISYQTKHDQQWDRGRLNLPGMEVGFLAGTEARASEAFISRGRELYIQIQAQI